ncbi:peptidase S10 serine carboxypeptidase [Acetobacter malorum]|uniref:Peptidase S10 serine carboxypeptidase n=1 Tax=Acetobacter malorum TaxID=178901 RepID=A0A177G627_9PROT|nr:peptidase S10 serine carboxypeptidase [Acetobacter malorum]
MRKKQTGLKLFGLLATVSVLAAGANAVVQPRALAEDTHQAADAAKQKVSVEDFLGKPQSVTSSGSVTVHGAHIDYEAVSGTLIVHKGDWDDSELARCGQG